MAHGHGHGHGHGSPDLNEKNLLFATVLNLVITVAEIVGGILSNSLALLSDAIHNLGDTFAVALAYIANRISKRDANEKRTYGYKRIQILAALLNALVLIVITFYLFFEAVKRFRKPEPIEGSIMFWVAIVGLLANLVAVIILRKDSRKSINIKAAYLHLLGDTISSVAVIVGSVIILFYQINWVDPLITILIGIYILKEAVAILKESVEILMQSTPASINLQEIVDELEKFIEISNIHHVHAWTLDDKQLHFECHADLEKDLPTSQTDLLRLELEKTLYDKFEITHVTIQFEFNCCDEKKVIHTR